MLSSILMSISLVIGGAVTVLSVLPYVLHLGALCCLKPQDLKKKYGAQWALVTGASSGEQQLLHCLRPYATTSRALMLSLAPVFAAISQYAALMACRHWQGHRQAAGCPKSECGAGGAAWTGAGWDYGRAAEAAPHTAIPQGQRPTWHWRLVHPWQLGCL